MCEPNTYRSFSPMYSRCSDQLKNSGFSQTSRDSRSQASRCSSLSVNQPCLAASRPSLPSRCSCRSGKPSKWRSICSGFVK